MADEPDFTTLKDQYAARVTADLEANQQDQARIRAELDSLKGQLEALERDHGLLQTMQHTLVSTAGAAAQAAAQASAATETAKAPRKRTTKSQSTAKTPSPAAASASTPTAAPVPKPRKARAQKPETTEVEETTKSKTARTAKAVKGTKAAQSPRKAASQAKKPTRKSAENSGPTLREVVLGLFAGHQEPRTVADILTELTTHHPERNTSPQVVRNTLEALVAKGELERERKQGSVFYTASRAAAPAEKQEEKTEAPTAATEGVAAPATASAPAPATA